MPFKPGDKGNPNGRPPGSPNKATKQIREFISSFLDENFENVVEAFNELKPRERVKFYIDLLQYGVPKLQSTAFVFDKEKLTAEHPDEPIDLKNLTDEQLESLVDIAKQLQGESENEIVLAWKGV